MSIAVGYALFLSTSPHIAIDNMVLLTGATGFLGRHLLRSILDWAGQVRVIVRDRARLHAVIPPDANAPGVVDAFIGDLTDSHLEWHQLLQGVDRVVHSAALVRTGCERRAAMQRINVEATRRLLEALPRDVYLLYIGSVIVYGPTQGETKDERSPLPDVNHSPYEETKRAATCLIREAVTAGHRCGILHPGIIYGGGAHGALTHYASLVAKKRMPFFAGANSRAGFVHVNDVAACAIEMLKRNEVDEFIAVGETATYRRFLEDVAEVGNGKAPRFELPIPLLSALVAFPSWLAKRMKKDFPVTPTLLRNATLNWEFSNAKAERLLGVHFRNNRDGIADWLA